jgi:hypothetical protein
MRNNQRTTGTDLLVEHRTLLWDAINRYMEPCGGTHARVYGNTRRQRAVAEIENIVYRSARSPECSSLAEQTTDKNKKNKGKRNAPL